MGPVFKQDSKLERFLPTNQHTQRKWLHFENHYGDIISKTLSYFRSLPRNFTQLTKNSPSIPSPLKSHKLLLSLPFDRSHLGLSWAKKVTGIKKARPRPKATSCSEDHTGIKYDKRLAQSPPPTILAGKSSMLIVLRFHWAEHSGRAMKWGFSVQKSKIIDAPAGIWTHATKGQIKYNEFMKSSIFQNSNWKIWRISALKGFIE